MDSNGRPFTRDQDAQQIKSRYIMNDDLNNDYLPETKGEEGSKTVSTDRVFTEHLRPS
jgi:hypothetical protein